MAIIGMALAPWNVLGGGKIRTDAEEQKRIQSGEDCRSTWGDWMRTESECKVYLALEEVAAEIGAKSITAGGFLCITPGDYLQRQIIDRSYSCHRVDYEKGTLRLSHNRRTQD